MLHCLVGRVIKVSLASSRPIYHCLHLARLTCIGFEDWIGATLGQKKNSSDGSPTAVAYRGADWAHVQDPTNHPMWTGDEKQLADTGQVAKLKKRFEGWLPAPQRGGQRD